MILRVLSRIVLVLLLIAIAAVWWARREPPVYPEAYVGHREATLWSTAGQVRQPLATLRYGEPVAVLRRSGDYAEVRAADGAQGWMDAGLLLDAALWREAAQLLARTRELPVQATGRTRTISNVRIGPGRDAPRIYQFRSGVPVEVLGRAVVPAPAEAAAGGGNEGWLLVRRAEGRSALEGPDIPIAGWVLGRFIELEPPPPLPEYATAARMRIVAWAILNSVPDESGDKPQYVVAGTRGGDGDACDFTMLRVYTWGARRQRYETAFIENEVCGRLPLRVEPAPAGAEFRFPEGSGGEGERLYRLRDTIVRRIRAEVPAR